MPADHLDRGLRQWTGNQLHRPSGRRRGRGERDTLIVRAGVYTPFMASGKVLTILGAGALVTQVSNPPPVGSLFGETRIDGVPHGAVFYVSGIRFAPISFPQFPSTPPIAALRISGAGVVVLSDATTQGASFVGLGNPGPDVLGGAEVHVSRCTFGGGSEGAIGTAGQEPAWVQAPRSQPMRRFSAGAHRSRSFPSVPEARASTSRVEPRR